MARPNRLGHLFKMIDDKIRERVRAELKRQKLSAEWVSREADLGATYVRDFLKRSRGKIEHLISVARVLGKSPAWLLYGEEAPENEVAERRDAILPNARGREPTPIYGAPIDVIGVSRGGDDGELIFNGEIIESIPRPPELEGVEGAYASYVTGDSMYPRFKEGERVWVHPRRPVRRGHDVIVQIHPRTDGEPPAGYIKEFVAYAGSQLVLKQHNPPKEIRFSRKSVKSVDVIVGSLYN